MPIIELGSNQQLVLQFDMIENRNRQFRLNVTHHNPDWSRSTLAPEQFMDGFGEAFFAGGRPSRSQRPSYRHYQYIFPNQDLRFRVSGNYMLRISDYNTDEVIFTIPFFIFENEGEIASSLDTIFAPRRQFRIQHQPRSRFTYPEFVEFPQFDLKFFFIQNRFWGQAREVDSFDTATPGSVYYEVSRSNAFIGDYEFKFLDLAELSQRPPEILDFQPGFVPPRLILNVDVQGLTNVRRQVSLRTSGFTKPELDARYGDIRFFFQPEQGLELNEESKIYIVGDFNNWFIRDENKMQFNAEEHWWEGSAYAKEGSYSYKYVLVQNGNIYDLALDDTFTRNRQEYTTFVYFRDPVQRHFRLLQSNTFFSN